MPIWPTQLRKMVWDERTIMSDMVEVREVWSRYPYRCRVCGEWVHKLLSDGSRIIKRDDSPHIHTAAEWDAAYPPDTEYDNLEGT